MHAPLNLRGVRGLVATIATLTLLATSSPLAQAAPRHTSGPVRFSAQQQRTDDSSLVYVVGVGTSDKGSENLASVGLVVDESGLILVSAGAVAPMAPGLAATYQSPGRDIRIDTVLVGATGKVVFGARVVAVDGYMDVAIIQVDSILEGKQLVPLSAGDFTLPAVSLATTSPTPGSPVTYLTIDQGIKTVQGTIDSAYQDARLAEPATFFTDISDVGQDPGGAVLDANGDLSLYPTWSVGGTPGSVFGTAAPFIAPVLDAARSGKEYVSPFDVAGSGQEAMTFDSWATAEPNPCVAADPGRTTTYPSGATRIAATFGYTDFTDDEDLFVLWSDPNPDARDPIIGTSLLRWGAGSAGDCFPSSLANGDSPLPDGDYAVTMFAGGALRFMSGAKVTVGGQVVPTADAVISGRVIDADTGKGIAKVAVIVLKPGTDLNSWLSKPDDKAVVAAGTTDKKGHYETRPAIGPDTYSILFLADGYEVAGGTVELKGGPIELEDVALAPQR